MTDTIRERISQFLARKPRRYAGAAKAEREVRFWSVDVVDTTPPKGSVGAQDFIVVIYHERPIWAIFCCPCGCGSIVSLSLQKVHSPKWAVTTEGSGRPTLYPSVWRNADCFSHFWISDGRVYWCQNSGIEPWSAEPLYYEKPGE